MLIARYGWKEVCLTTVLCILAAVGLWWVGGPWAALVAALPWLAIVAFFRDPPRRVTPCTDGLLAPADGVIDDLTPVSSAPFIGGPALRIGIFLSVLDVHLNRSPAAGIVAYRAAREGQFYDARLPEASLHNVAQDVGLMCPQWAGRRLLVRQITGAIARRIVCPLQLGDIVEAGERYGMIKFGSRTEVYVPADTSFVSTVSVGQKVSGGITVLGTFRA